MPASPRPQSWVKDLSATDVESLWDSSAKRPSPGRSGPLTVQIDDVEIGLREARREVDDGLYRSRWERATPAQREMMRALARIGGEEAATVSDIANTLGRSRTSDLSVARKELIKEGPRLRTRTRPTGVHGSGNERLHWATAVTVSRRSEPLYLRDLGWGPAIFSYAPRPDARPTNCDRQYRGAGQAT